MSVEEAEELDCWEEIVDENGDVCFRNQSTGELRSRSDMPEFDDLHEDEPQPEVKQPETESVLSVVAARFTEKVIEKAILRASRLEEAFRIVKSSSNANGHEPKLHISEADFVFDMSKAVDKIDKDGNVVKQFVSGFAACEELNLRPARLWKHLNRKAPSCQGLFFRFHGNQPVETTAEIPEGAFEGKLILGKASSNGVSGLDEVLSKLRRPGTFSGTFCAPIRILLNFQLVGDAGAEQLAQGLKGRAIKEIFLVASNIGSVGAGWIASALKGSQTIVSLHLNENQVTDEGVGLLAAGLADSSLRTLNLTANPISDIGAEHLSRMLVSHACKLECLILGGVPQKKIDFAEGSSTRKGSMFSCRIGPIGTALIAATLMRIGSPLKSLWLVDCIGLLRPSPGWRALCAALFFGRGLKELNVSFNNLPPSDFKVLFQSVKHSNLTSLVCCGCGLSEENERSLRAVTGRSPSPVDFKQQRLIGGLAYSLRQEAFQLLKERKITFPKEIRVSSTEPIDVRRRIFTNPLVPEDESVAGFLEHGIPFDQSIDYLDELSRHLHGSVSIVDEDIVRLKAMCSNLECAVVDLSAQLATASAAHKARSQQHTEVILAATARTRNKELSVQQTRHALEESFAIRTEYEADVTASEALLAELLDHQLADRKKFTTKVESVTERLTALRARLAHLRDSIPALQSRLGDETTQLEAARDAQRGFFEDAREDVRAYEAGKCALEAALRDKHSGLIQARNVSEAQAKLKARILPWLSSLDDYLDQVRSCKDWNKSVEPSGNPAIDQRLRSAYKYESVLRTQVAELAATVAENSRSGESSSEAELMRYEELLARAVVLSEAEMTTRRLKLEHRIVLSKVQNRAQPLSAVPADDFDSCVHGLPDHLCGTDIGSQAVTMRSCEHKQNTVGDDGNCSTPLSKLLWRTKKFEEARQIDSAVADLTTLHTADLLRRADSAGIQRDSLSHEEIIGFLAMATVCERRRASSLSVENCALIDP